MKTPLLLSVPRSHPSRKQKLEALKKTLGIETSYCRGLDDPWLAIHLPSARKFGYGVTQESDAFDCIQKVGRLLDEAGICTYGKTEKEAVKELCNNINIPIEL